MATCAAPGCTHEAKMSIANSRRHYKRADGKKVLATPSVMVCSRRCQRKQAERARREPG